MLQLGIRGLGIARFKFNPISWFLKGEPGAWYDPSDLTTLFQDSAGTIPVTAVEQPVGLMKDKSGRGNHASQATAGNRPILSARVNLLLQSEFASGWAVNVASITPTSTIAPDGTLTGATFAGAGTGLNALYNSGYSIVGSYTMSVYAKAGTHSVLQFYFGGVDTTFYANFDLLTGTIGSYGGTIVPPTITLVAGTTWYKCTYTAIFTGASSTNFNLVSSTTSGRAAAGNSSNYLYIWGADLRPTNAGALLPPYQRVNTVSDYDTVGFPLYLKANGTSSAMSTNSIDFSSTDKMTVVTGVRKLSDATIGIALELSAIADSNGGTFLLAPSFNGVSAAGAYYSAGAKGTNIARVTSGATYVAPISNINTFIDSISTPYADLRINGTQVATNTAGQGTGNFGNYPLYLFARAGTSLFLNGQFYGAIIRGAQSDTASVTRTENYMATKTGITF